MAFSIPETIQPIYTLPALDPEEKMLKVGALIKDLPPGSETTMKKANNAAILKIEQKYEADSAQFDKDYQAAEVKAKNAEKIIANARNKKITAITLLVATIIATVAIVAAAIVTQTWPILFIAVPCLIAFVPSSYYTYVFGSRVNKLEQDINAPSLMKKPVLKLPAYYPSQDLDLFETRIDIQNKLATMSIGQLFDANLSHDEIVGYGLLDRVTKIKPENRPTFYAKCIQLINSYGQIDKEHKQYRYKAKSEYTKLDRELQDWKSQQDKYIRSQELALNEQERTARQINEAHRRGEVVNVQTTGVLGTILSRWELNNMKSRVAEGYGRRDAQNRNWYDTTVRAIERAYQQASDNIENQYRVVKEAAAQ